MNHLQYFEYFYIKNNELWFYFDIAFAKLLSRISAKAPTA